MSSKLFIANVNWSAPEEEFAALLEERGEIVAFKMPINYQTGNHKGYAFVEMASEEQGQRILEELNGFIFYDRPLAVTVQDENRRRMTRPPQYGAPYGYPPPYGPPGYPPPYGPMPYGPPPHGMHPAHMPPMHHGTSIPPNPMAQPTEPNNKLFVRNVNPEAGHEELVELFGEFGEVHNVHIPVDRMTGMGRGFAFIELDSVENAVQAKENLDGTFFHDRTLEINFQDPMRQQRAMQRQFQAPPQFYPHY